MRFTADTTADGPGTWTGTAMRGTVTVAGRTFGLRWTQRSLTATATAGGAVLSLSAP